MGSVDPESEAGGLCPSELFGLMRLSFFRQASTSTLVSSSASPLRSSSRVLPKKDSTSPSSQGLPGSMNNVVA